MTHIYGIKNCSTVKKALNWFDENKLEYQFHDFKNEPPSEADITSWQEHLGWEPLVNRRGTTWRKIDKSRQETVVDASSASVLLREQPSLIKRPVVVSKSGYLLGFDSETYQKFLL